jgi:HSP20 family protein
MNEALTRQPNGTQKEAPRSVARRVALTPRVDILEQPNQLVLFVELPAVKSEDVELHFENGELTLRAHRDFPTRPGRCLVEQFDTAEYSRVFLLGQDIAADKIVAELHDGVLRVELPRAAAALPRKITVAC